VIPFYAYDEAHFFACDDAPAEIAARRRAGFMRLAALYRERFAQTAAKPLRESLTDLGTQAVEASAPYSDNTSAAALRWRAA